PGRWKRMRAPPIPMAGRLAIAPPYTTPRRTGQDDAGVGGQPAPGLTDLPAVRLARSVGEWLGVGQIQPNWGHRGAWPYGASSGWRRLGHVHRVAALDQNHAVEVGVRPGDGRVRRPQAHGDGRHSFRHRNVCDDGPPPTILRECFARDDL